MGIRLASLRKVADALECDVVYAVVPRHPDGLQGLVRDQSLRIARAELAPIRHTMALEAQALSARSLTRRRRRSWPTGLSTAAGSRPLCAGERACRPL